jgi:hypothetical protein
MPAIEHTAATYPKMNAAAAQFQEPTHTPIVREYDIGNTKYVVRATVKDGANEDAVTKVRRMIRNDMGRKAGN